MRTEKVLILGAVTVLVLGSILAVALPTGMDEEPQPPGEVSVTDMDLSLGEVTGETVEFEVVPRLSHSGGVSENLTVVVRATRTSTELLASEEETEVGRLEGNGETEVEVPVVVEREGEYVFDVVVYKDDRRVSTASRRIEGVGSVQPEYAESGIAFFSFPLQPSIEYSIGSVGSDVELRTASYLANRGNDAEEVSLAVEARQADSMIVADRQEVSVTIPAGSVQRIPAELNVPDGYNYYLDATAWKDDNIVATHRNVANLRPNENIEVNREEGGGSLRVTDFESEELQDQLEQQESTESEEEREEEAEGQPGFTAVVVLFSLVVFAVARKIK
ncbi:MAG: hypothetical protein U5J64_08985 [Halobacteriales archaeon]|nr:hypothetical protein [Halobacteriales archaeon]